ncbi:hypothetical protein FA13DRAFT_1640934 [Coprinellus micaceus]|uniref:Fungal-type protein kinase domain-containing protein n=1 Tax=Coprinellus micaceus TaxID=71717 RepID=A0A4Y7SLB8_COPMI|nr:hypothetical protein FA13DRAFT_1640934 [Coprinellus micaceus]
MLSTRITMKSYGKSLLFFTSALQLLCAVRDAIAAHQKLVCVRVLYRDGSHNNVFLGKEGAAEGDKGVIYRFWHGFSRDGKQHRAPHLPPMSFTCFTHTLLQGTRLFQSLYVLHSSYPGERPPAHDYLADPDSFLCLLAYVFLLYKPDASHFQDKDPGPSIVRR